MTINKDQWDQIKHELQGSYGRVKLSLEGKKITLQKALVKENQLAILVFVDGRISAGWGFPDQSDFREFVKKLWRKRTIAIYKPKEKERIIKAFGKRGAKKFFPRLNEVREFWVADFSTFDSMRRVLQKNKSLEVITIGYSAEGS